MSAEYSKSDVLIKFPDGIVLTHKDLSMNFKLSQTLNQNVTLTKEDEIAHFDDGAIHILTTASLSLLGQLLPNSCIDTRRFRPNIVIDSQYYDQDLIGKTVKIGETIFEITHKTERCRMITMAQPNLEKQPKILKSVSQQFGLYFGVYAKVLSTGRLSIGMPVEIIRK